MKFKSVEEIKYARQQVRKAIVKLGCDSTIIEGHKILLDLNKMLKTKLVTPKPRKVDIKYMPSHLKKMIHGIDYSRKQKGE